MYSDHGISGATILRPAYQNLLEDMRRGHFEVIVTEALDRLSRDQENVAALYKQASFAGVNVVTLAEGEISELHVGFSGAMNALYLKLSLLLTPSGAETLVFWVSQPLPWPVALKDVPLMTRRGDLKLSHGATAKARENAVKQDRVPTTNAIKSP